MDCLKGTCLRQALALHTNIEPDWTGLPGSKTTLSSPFINYKEKEFYRIGPCQKMFESLELKHKKLMLFYFTFLFTDIAFHQRNTTIL